jgi:hypothetical protein
MPLNKDAFRSKSTEHLQSMLGSADYTADAKGIARELLRERGVEAVEPPPAEVASVPQEPPTRRPLIAPWRVAAIVVGVASIVRFVSARESQAEERARAAAAVADPDYKDTQAMLRHETPPGFPEMVLAPGQRDAPLAQLSQHLGWIILSDPQTQVADELVASFNRASQQARSGDPAAALAAWNEFLREGASTPQERPPGAKQPVASADFVASCFMRRAYAQIDVGDLRAAKLTFERPELRAALGGALPATLKDYYFSYGNTLRGLDLLTMSELLRLRADPMPAQ